MFAIINYYQYLSNNYGIQNVLLAEFFFMKYFELYFL